MRRAIPTVLALVLAAGLTVQLAAQDEKPPTAKEIMIKLNKGPNSLCPKIGQALKDDPVDWDAVAKQAEQFGPLAEALGKAKPRRGEADKWAKTTEAYAATAKELADAVEKKDQGAAVAAHKKLAAACQNCHKDFR